MVPFPLKNDHHRLHLDPILVPKTRCFARCFFMFRNSARNSAPKSREKETARETARSVFKISKQREKQRVALFRALFLETAAKLCCLVNACDEHLVYGRARLAARPSYSALTVGLDTFCAAFCHYST